MSSTSRIATLIYGTVSYLIFLGVFMYSIGFVGNLVLPKTVDSGVPGPLGVALAVNFGLLTIFALQHSIMARPAFKAWWKQYVPVQAERSTYVLLSSLALALLYWQWQPMTTVIWDIQSPIAHGILMLGYFSGWALVLYSTVLIDHFDLFGMRQVVLNFREMKYSHHPFDTPSLYQYIRHPLYLGWFTVFWVTPTMTGGHLLLAGVTTAYILVAVVLEERDLVSHFGDAYRRYQETIPKFFPFGRNTAKPAPKATSAAVARQH